MTSKTSEFAKLINDVDAMSDEQQRIIADGHQEDEHFTLSADDFASYDDFQRAVVAELIKLLNL